MAADPWGHRPASTTDRNSHPNFLFSSLESLPSTALARGVVLAHPLAHRDSALGGPPQGRATE